MTKEGDGNGRLIRSALGHIIILLDQPSYQIISDHHPSSFLILSLLSPPLVTCLTERSLTECRKITLVDCAF